MDRRKIVGIIYIACYAFAILVMVALFYYGEKKRAKGADPQDPIVAALAAAETGDILFLREPDKSPQRILLTRLENGRFAGQVFALNPSHLAENSGFLVFQVNIPYGNPVENINLIKKNDYLGYGSAMSLMTQEAIDYSQGKR